MKKRTRHLYWPFLMLIGSMLLAGCSGIDDLRICNNYPFAVRVRHKEGDMVGMVPPHSTANFHGAAGYRGDQVDGTTYEDEKGKKRGVLGLYEPNMERNDFGSINGTATWIVTLGPPASSQISWEQALACLITAGVCFLVLPTLLLRWRIRQRQQD